MFLFQLVQDLRKNFNAGVTKPIESRLHTLGQLNKLITECEDQFYDAIYKDLRKVCGPKYL